jgi:hypothetical protein
MEVYHLRVCLADPGEKGNAYRDFETAAIIYW